MKPAKPAKPAKLAAAAIPARWAALRLPKYEAGLEAARAAGPSAKGPKLFDDSDSDSDWAVSNLKPPSRGRPNVTPHPWQRTSLERPGGYYSNT